MSDDTPFSDETNHVPADTNGVLDMEGKFGMHISWVWVFLALLFSLSLGGGRSSSFDRIAVVHCKVDVLFYI